MFNTNVDIDILFSFIPQNMIKNASNYLFEMTKHRFFFKSVKILIPKTWKKNTNYSRIKTESYDQVWFRELFMIRTRKSYTDEAILQITAICRTDSGSSYSKLLRAFLG